MPTKFFMVESKVLRINAEIIICKKTELGNLKFGYLSPDLKIVLEIFLQGKTEKSILLS